MNFSEASFIEWIKPTRSLSELVDAAKALTWEHYCEHAVVELDDGRQALVQGGRLGIKFLKEESRVFVTIECQQYQVTRVVFHTHPLVTGPSDWDLDVLEMLGQKESLLFEIGGEPEGTRIRPKAK